MAKHRTIVVVFLIGACFGAWLSRMLAAPPSVSQQHIPTRQDAALTQPRDNDHPDGHHEEDVAADTHRKARRSPPKKTARPHNSIADEDDVVAAPPRRSFATTSTARQRSVHGNAQPEHSVERRTEEEDKTTAQNPSGRSLSIVDDGKSTDITIGETSFKSCEPKGRNGMGRRTVFYSTAERLSVAKVACFSDGWERQFERYIVREAQRLDGDVVEIGANVGLFTQALGHAVLTRPASLGEGSRTRKVFAFDADPITFAALSAGLRRSPVTKLVIARHAAISGTSGEMQFCVRPQYQINSRIVTDNKPCVAQFPSETGPLKPFAVPVPALTPANVFSEPLGSYSFVKIDADWAEGLIWQQLAKLHAARGSERFRSFTIETNVERNNVMTAKDIAMGVEEIYGSVGVTQERGEDEVCVKVRGDAQVWSVRGSDHVICAGSDIIFS